MRLAAIKMSSNGSSVTENAGGEPLEVRLNLSHKEIFDIGMRHAVMYKNHGINIKGYEIAQKITDKELKIRIEKTRDYIEALHEAKSVQEIARIIEIAGAIYRRKRRNVYWDLAT